MQEIEHVKADCVVAGGCKTGDVRIGSGQRSLAQIEVRRKTLDHAAHNSLRITGLDLAFYGHG